MLGLALLAALAAPAAYAAQTASTAHSGSLPTAGPAGSVSQGGPGGGGFGGGRPNRRRRAAGPGSRPAARRRRAGSAAPGGRTGFAPGGGTGLATGGGSGFGGPGGVARGGAGGLGGLLDAGTPSKALVALVGAQAASYRWVAAVVGSNSAASVELATGDPVMAIGGFNGTDPDPTLAAFKADVAAGQIHYFIAASGGGRRAAVGSSASSTAIARWVESTFTAPDRRRRHGLRPRSRLDDGVTVAGVGGS